jgi:cysteine-rich repeat protein
VCAPLTLIAITSSASSISSASAMSSACTLDTSCGDGTRCIQGSCLNRVEIAQLPSFCGNARIDAGEQCDDGSLNSNNPNASCRPNCTLSRCGDGIIDTPLELCDDGNLQPGDGCSASCKPEHNAPQVLPSNVVQLPFQPSGNEGTSYQTQGTNTVVGSVTEGSSQVLTGGANRPPSNTSSGPEALVIMISGAAAGYAYMKRRR